LAASRRRAPAAATALPAALTKAVAEAADSDKPGSLSQIEHVVVFMQENRSFDTYFGTRRAWELGAAFCGQCHW
jgi:phospholipase C